MSSEPSETISEFCRNVKISRPKYFQMRRDGKGPAEMRDGKWVRISPEAKQKWRRERERAGRKTSSTT
jgi:hypothetical protein